MTKTSSKTFIAVQVRDITYRPKVGADFVTETFVSKVVSQKASKEVIMAQVANIFRGLKRSDRAALAFAKKQGVRIVAA